MSCTRRFFNVADGAQMFPRAIGEDTTTFTCVAEMLDRNSNVVASWNHQELTSGAAPFALSQAAGRHRLEVEMASPAGAQVLVVVALVEGAESRVKQCLVNVGAGGAGIARFSFFF